MAPAARRGGVGAHRGGVAAAARVTGSGPSVIVLSAVNLSCAAPRRTDGRLVARVPSGGRVFVTALMALLIAFVAPAAGAVAAVPVNSVAPTFSGVLQEGELLTADPGTWTASPTSYSYAWYSCNSNDFGGVLPECGPIGANQPTYLLGAADVGRYIGVEVSAANAEGSSVEPGTALPRGPVIVGYPEVSTYPTVGGTPQDGQTLTADPGTWTPAADSYTFQWYACDAAMTVCDVIDGATARTYRLGPADVGRRYGVAVVASNAGGPSDVEISEPTEPVLAAPGTTTPPPTPGPGGTTPPPAPGATAPPPAPGGATRPTTPSPFAMLRKLARANGNLELSVRARRAGRFTARATASAALLARGCVRSCKRTGRADFGRVSLTTSAAGVVKLVVKPTARAARALRKSASLPLRVTLTFRPAGGGATSTRTYSLTVKGALARRPGSSRR